MERSAQKPHGTAGMSGLWADIKRLARVPNAVMRGMRAARDASYMVVDADGVERRAEIVSQVRKWPWRRTVPERLASHLAEVERQRPFAAMARGMQYAIGILQVFFGVMFLSCAVAFRSDRLFVAIAIHLMFFVTGAVFLFRARRPAALFGRFKPEAIVLHTTEAGLCPGCMYDLANAPRRNDGVCICPECAAAWRIGTKPQ